MEKLKIITTFTGIGMQERGIYNAKGDYELINTSEIDADAIISYAAIHRGLTKELIVSYTYPETEEMIAYLEKLRINYDYTRKAPYNWRRRGISDEKIKKVWLACNLNRNLGDISLVEHFCYCDILTFSFPCTDLATCGRQKGIINNENTVTRSGLVFEIIRILSNNLRDDLKLPKVLLMENVSALINRKNIEAYRHINEEFKKLGYLCSYCVMNAKDYGIPQNRERVFAVYMLDKQVYNTFKFPVSEKLSSTLNDYLLDLQAKYIIDNDKSAAFLKHLDDFKYIKSDRSNHILDYLGALVNNKWLKTEKELSRNQRQGYRVYSSDGISPGLATNVGGYGVVSSLIYDTKHKVVRRLSPEEAFLLMGMKVEDCKKCRELGVSDTQLYRQAGNGLVTNCIERIMEEL